MPPGKSRPADRLARYYRITKDGRAALRSFSLQWDRFRSTVDALLG